jgi:hypothetical protein
MRESNEKNERFYFDDETVINIRLNNKVNFNGKKRKIKPTLKGLSNS